MQLITLKTSDKMKKVSDANPYKGISASKLFQASFFIMESKNCVTFVADWFWVDASDIGQRPGQFVWADGTKVDEALWKNEHRGAIAAGKETCAELWTETGKLYDIGCTYAQFSFICELAEDVTC